MRSEEGSPGLRQAAAYIKKQLELIKERADSKFRIEIEETVVNGSFNMMFLGQSISLTYRNHTNILMRISSIDSQDSDPSVLLNGHFDTPPGSLGAGDCGSCVASLLELARLTVDSGWLPPRPIIFLFNGAEELFMLGSHGFMTTHRWRDTVGAFINVEASGTGGFGKSLDFLCIQIGKDLNHHKMWLLMANYPPHFLFSCISMANSAAQDVFGSIPGDSDYRMFAKDYGDIPALDMIFLLGPGSMQARGDNMFSLMKAFVNSSNLLTAQERESLRADASGSEVPITTLSKELVDKARFWGAFGFYTLLTLGCEIIYILLKFLYGWITGLASAVDEIKSVYSYSAREKELSKEDEQINDEQHAGLVNVEKKVYRKILNQMTIWER
ncbi:hypothetical protein ACS0TY_009170 [Phlomoides rotata]